MPETWTVTVNVPPGTGAPTVNVQAGLVGIAFPANVIGTPDVEGPQSGDDEPEVQD